MACFQRQGLCSAWRYLPLGSLLLSLSLAAYLALASPSGLHRRLQAEQLVPQAPAMGGSPSVTSSDQRDPALRPWVEPISWQPRAFVYHHFLSDAECDHIVALAKPQMRRSTVVGDNGGSVTDSIRTSYGTFLRRFSDPVLTKVEHRLARWTHLNITYQEDMQILRYAKGQKYGAHYDSLADQSPRIATVLMYLGNGTLDGGETAFPVGSSWLHPSLAGKFGPFSPCAEQHLAVKPRKGMALLFYSLKPTGESDYSSMHTGCPVIEGIKWTATKWIHTGPFHEEWINSPESADPKRDPEVCMDYEDRCSGWAKSGECKKNPAFMVGDNFSLGACRKACQQCTICKPLSDIKCRSQNREQAGFLPILD
ncbi:hypothetical protein WJX74_005333 [Apatococcus lobatus]|uniref:procollagen-proline 4-dioxygenase n=1 Tax=Apatococcus lobatus TaxID=904363 RepID=A0AAW1S9S4_9CHLO